jgi:hypothetical protein
MLHRHSFLWHYLWVAPDFLLFALGFLIWRRGLHRKFPAFFCYVLFESAGGAILYSLDVSPRISGPVYWRSYFVFLAVEVFVKFAVLGEIFIHLVRPYPSLARLARGLITGLVAILVLPVTIIAAYANVPTFWLISATRVLGRSVNVIQCGVIIFLFIFAAHFGLSWGRGIFSIALGFGIISSVYLAYWALAAANVFGPNFFLLDFIVMAAYHFCVLIWLYYLLVPERKTTKSAVSLPENNLAVWNRELERLLQQ